MRGKGRRRSNGELRVLAVDVDPHTLDEVRRALPDARIIIGPEGENGHTADLVVVDLGRAPVPSEESRGTAKVVGVLPLHGSAPTADVDAVLQRPLLTGEFSATVDRVLGTRVGDRNGQAGWLVQADWWIARLRFVTIAWAAVVSVVAPMHPHDHVVLAGVLLYALLRLPIRSRRAIVLADVVIVAALLQVTGGPSSGYLLLALLTAAQAGVFLGAVPGTAAALILVLGGLPHLVMAGRIVFEQLLAWLVLLPLAAAAGGFMAAAGVRSRDGLSALVEANRLFRDLHDIARVSPGSLDAPTVAETTTSAAHELGFPAGLLFVDDGAEARLLSAYGHARADYRPFSFSLLSDLASDEFGIHRGDHLPPPLPRLLEGHDEWLVVPLRCERTTLGVLFAAVPHRRVSKSIRRRLRAAAEEAAIGIENARIFSRLRDIALDVERWRLATDLHDGVAQELAHVRLELDLLTRQTELSAQELRDELLRIKSVTRRALSDVRDMVEGLRASAAGTGLTSALGEYVRDFGVVAGPRVTFAARRSPTLDRDVERQVYRVAQEAISNAVHHAEATAVTVTLDVEGEEMSLCIQDDGKGFSGLPGPSGDGVGLRSMEERAARIGGRLTVESVAGGGGTCVELRLPLDGKVGQQEGVS